MRVTVSLSGRISEAGRWEDRAACRGQDPELFWPVDSDRWGAVWAKKVCRSCDVREECLQTALDEGHTEGIWGGLAPTERQALNRRGGVTS